MTPLVTLFFALTLALPTASTARPDPPRSNTTLIPRQNDGAKGCGLVTDAAVTMSYTLVGDAYCRDLHAHGADIKSYTIVEGCICMFYAKDRCSKKPTEEWTGWVFGQAKGDFKKKGTSHYLCGEGSNPFMPPRG